MSSGGGWGSGSGGRGPSRGGRWDDQDDMPARSSSRRPPPSGRDPRDPRDARSPRDSGRGSANSHGPDRSRSRYDDGGAWDGGGAGGRRPRNVDLDDPRPASRSGGRSSDRGQMGGSSRTRDDWGEAPRGGRGSREGEHSRGSSRGAREDAWAPAGSRSAHRGDASGSRSRRPIPPSRGGGLWGDDADQGFGRPSAADPRAARRGSVRAGASRSRSTYGRGRSSYDADPSSTGKALMMGLGAMLGAAVLGAGGAYGYWKLSAPKPPTTATTTPAVTSPTTSGTPSTTPGKTPSPSPHASVGNDTRTVWIASDGRVLS